MSAVSEQSVAQDEDSAEASYRRGYQQGANDTLMAVERLGHSRVDLSSLRVWIGVTLYQWRYHDRAGDRGVQPP
ncbi:MAG: hypothetical protein HYZ60_08620, partial [Methylocystis sp.]|nr:hypothetical protein [Methylocystis sp.]